MQTLVVVGEGERGYAYLLVRMLRQLGHDVLTVDTPRHAIEVLHAGISAVAINLEMSNPGAIALAEAISKVAPATPVAYYSDGTSEAARFRQARALAPIVPKPLSADQARALDARLTVLPATRLAS